MEGQRAADHPAIVEALHTLAWEAHVYDDRAREFAGLVLRAVADSWAPDGQYTADDLRGIADQFDPAASDA